MTTAPSNCAALAAIVLCTLAQGHHLSVRLDRALAHACLQQHHRDVLCVAWQPATVEPLARAG